MSKIIKLFAAYIIYALINCQQLSAQQNHFIYIQADDKQTFSVEVNNKTYNSSDIGYVIIPKLTDGTYQLNISFPDNKFPDQQFNCVINKADAGYALKNFGEKGWGLFNFQSLEVMMAGNNTVVAEAQKDTTKMQNDTVQEQSDTVKTNAFGEMLSQVVNDTTLKIEPIEQPANKPAAEIASAALSDSLQKASQNQTSPANTLVVLNKSMIKIAEQSTDEGVNMVFVDPASGNDTIRIFVPLQQEKSGDSAIVQNETKDSVTKNETTEVAAVDTMQSVPETKQEDKTSLTDTSAGSQAQVNNPFFTGNETKDTLSKSAVENNSTESKPAETNPAQATYKADCSKMLSDNDLDKLKKKMVSGSNNEKMIQTARKYFQDKCITTEQVRNLGALFLSDDARYSFFDAAYPNVYDIAAFASLENQLVDPYYKKRFRAMLR